jgi:hypothetical protein
MLRYLFQLYRETTIYCRLPSFSTENLFPNVVCSISLCYVTLEVSVHIPASICFAQQWETLILKLFQYSSNIAQSTAPWTRAFSIRWLGWNYQCKIMGRSWVAAESWIVKGNCNTNYRYETQLSKNETIQNTLSHFLYTRHHNPPCALRIIYLPIIGQFCNFNYTQ